LGFRQSLTGAFWRRERTDDPREHFVRQIRIAEDEYRRLPQDGTMYHTAVEIWLSKVLAEPEGDDTA
jgi:hypothetical protein